MAPAALIEWEGKEYEHRPKSADWYWALGIIAVASVIAAILFRNYLFALLLAIATAVIALHSVKRPATHTFRLHENGLSIGEEFHPFERMTSFSVLEDIEGVLPPMLSIKTDHWLASHLEIPLENVDADAVYAHLLESVHENEHHPTFAHAIAKMLGF